MALWSRVRRWLRPSAASTPAGFEEPALLALPALIEDWNAAAGTGVAVLQDGAALSFTRTACRDFQPLIGLRVEVLATGVPGLPDDPRGLLATALRLRPGTEAEYQARLRIAQVERAVRGGEPSPAGPQGLPPWARDKSGLRPAGPGRPQDAFFVLTVLLEREMHAEAATLAAWLRSSFLRQPEVRLIPLATKGRPEPGFCAEVKDAGRRAFLLYRPQPYLAGSDEAPEGPVNGPAGHIGLFVGGPHSPRTAALLPRPAQSPPPLAPDGEVRLLSDLARSLLKSDIGAAGLIVNRADKHRKPLETALAQLGDEDRGEVPFLLWIDWNMARRDGRLVHLSRGMESLGLPDVAVVLRGEEEVDRSRLVLWYACRCLVRGELAAEAAALAVPRGITLEQGSQLLIDDLGDTELYRVEQRSGDLLVLAHAQDLPAP